MAQPFALDRLASKVGLSQKRAQQDYFDARASEATELLEKQLDKMREKASEKGGIFGQFGKHAGLMKTLSTVALNAIPGFGQAAALALNAADLAKSQDDMSKNIKAIGKTGGVPSRFKGTFLENYLEGGRMGAASQLKTSLKGAKMTNLLTGLASLVPSALGAAGQTGDLLKLTSKSLDPASVANNIMAGTGGKSNILNIVNPTAPSKFGNLLNKIGQGVVPGTLGTTTLEDLINPLINTGIKDKTLGGKIIKGVAESALTPMSYAPLLQDLYQSYLTKPTEEPVMTRAQAPKFY
tara:strand:- start:1846 stop:2730 length:885 start_codon:yes stop_codon:yes gene_type:complete